jgi:hypothetical protein
MNVCDGGTITGGVTSIHFSNPNTSTSYTITSCKDSNGNTMPGWPAIDPVIPIAANGVNGSHTVQLAVAAISGKTYNYTPSPACTIGTNPQIKVS